MPSSLSMKTKEKNKKNSKKFLILILQSTVSRSERGEKVN